MFEIVVTLIQFRCFLLGILITNTIYMEYIKEAYYAGNSSSYYGHIVTVRYYLQNTQCSFCAYFNFLKRSNLKIFFHFSGHNI